MMQCRAFLLLVITSFLALPAWAEDPLLAISQSSGNAIVSGYSSSHALLIEQSDYPTGPWDDLESIPGEQDRVEALLREEGFQTVTRVRNQDLAGLRAGFDNFMKEHGFERDARLFIFYSGHGYTTPDGKAYLVPRTEADPRQNLAQFKKEALDMNQVASWARQMDAKHVLFVFDSCFSGSIFGQRGPRNLPQWISRLTQEPVRYFITAGSANEQVPAQSVLVPNLVRGLRFGLADLNKDGFVTSGELGVYLREHIITTGVQTPQFGPLREPQFDGGDVVFRVPDPNLLAVEDQGESAASPSEGGPAGSAAGAESASSASIQGQGGALGSEQDSVVAAVPNSDASTSTNSAAAVGAADATAVLKKSSSAERTSTPAGPEVAAGGAEAAPSSSLSLEIPQDAVDAGSAAQSGPTAGDSGQKASGGTGLATSGMPTTAVESAVTGSASPYDGDGARALATADGDQPVGAPVPEKRPTYAKWLLGAVAVGLVAAVAGGGKGGGDSNSSSTSNPPGGTGTLNVDVPIPTK